MIESLRIENFAIVESEALEFGPGLNVLTGETGAGKSIVLGALSLLAGARASVDLVRGGCDEAVVEAQFRTDALPELQAELERRGLGGDDRELVVRRSVLRNGRSRARVGGELVPAALLAELFTGRIEISSQHDSQALLRSEVHGLLLDRAGGLLDEREAVGEGARTLRELDEEVARLRAAERGRERERDFLAFQVHEIDDAGLDAAEIAELQLERSRLAHAERLADEGRAALALLAGDPEAGDGSGAGDLLSEAARHLEGVAALDPRLGALAARLAAAREEVRDAAAELERHTAGLEADPARLAAVDERLAQVEALGRKYGAGVEEILAFRATAAAQLEELLGADARTDALAAERTARAERLAASAASLSAARKQAARRLGREVERALRELAMPEARFAVALEPNPAPEGAPCGPGGFERADFRFAAGAGAELRLLRRVASGGELSRLLLAIKSAIREADAGMVLVFDEVDAGIGGRTADRVGRSLAELAGHHQILCITHLPQIAAYADTHFRVDKSDARSGARARIQRVEGNARVEEIARMAGGERVSDATRRHAHELLRTHARPPRP